MSEPFIAANDLGINVAVWNFVDHFYLFKLSFRFGKAL